MKAEDFRILATQVVEMGYGDEILWQRNLKICEQPHLFYEKQIQGFRSIEQALITIGIKLCKNSTEKKAFFDKYATPYNLRIKNIK